MEIYIKVLCNGPTGWWTFDRDGGECYICNGNELYDPAHGFCRGTACKSAVEAKKQARAAKRAAEYDGYAEVRIEFWRFAHGELVLTKFTKDGKIK